MMSGASLKEDQINDNPTTEPGNNVINGMVWSSHTKNRTGKLYGVVSAALRQEILNKEPVFTLADVASNPVQQHENGTYVRVFSTLNMLGKKGESFASIKRRVRFVGFARSEPMHQGMGGRINGTVAIHVGGLMTIINTGPFNIPAGSLLRMRLPDPALVSQEWIDRDPEKVVGEVVPYEPTVDDASRQRGFAVLSHIMSGRDVSADVAEDGELQAYVDMWQAMRTFAFVAVTEFSKASGAKLTTDDALVIAKLFGVVTPRSEDDKIKAAKFQKRLMKRTFIMNTDDDGNAYYDASQLYFPLTQDGSMVERMDTQDLAQQHASMLETLMNSVVMVNEDKRSEVFGMAPTGGLPMQPMDVVVGARIL